MSFHSGSHGNQALDIENFLKPTVDAIAAGLFASEQESFECLARWHFDDSNFHYLFAHRLEPAPTAAQEGLWAAVSEAAD
jgi:hypothetical protein